MNATGLFVVFEGIDGSGKSTQREEVARAICKWNKYQPVDRDREPTWRAEEIKKRLESEKDPESNGVVLANLFIEDRRRHYFEDIRPAIERRRVVLCDRYAMFTLAYQSLQGQSMFNLVSLHFSANIRTPDITFYIAISAEEATRRIALRGEAHENHDGFNFATNLCEQYEFLYRESQREGQISNLLGRVVKIDGAQDPQHVTSDILSYFEPVYRERLSK
jgi:dTMP kinase